VTGTLNSAPPTNYTKLGTTVGYSPHGGLASMTLGTGTALNETRVYNGRLQPTSIAVGSLMTLGFTYGAADNNGNVISQTVQRSGVPNVTQTFEYDNVNRLKKAISSTTGWAQEFSYDPWGNRAQISSGPGPETPVPADLAGTTNNRVNNWKYDPAGNLIGIPSTPGSTNRASCVNTTIVGTGPMLRTSCYDAEGRMTSVTDLNSTKTTYAYDSEGRRIQKVNQADTTTYVYDAMGQLAAEYGGRAALPDETGTRYLFGDHLGSTRLTVKGDGTGAKSLDYLPFGEEIGGGSYPVVGGGMPVKFTGKERDAETGLDYMLARYYSAGQGRFTSPDEWAGGIVDAYSGGAIGKPGPLPYADISDPQTINKYAYVRNNPLRYTDPTGHCFFGGGVPCSFEEFKDTVKDRVIGGLKFEANAMLDMTILGKFIDGRLTPSNAIQAEAMEVGEGIKPEFQQAVLMAIPGPKGEKGETLSRQGPSRESAGRLGRKAAEAEAQIGIHGVSTTAGQPKGESSSAARGSVEQSFPVHDTPTRADPLHRTVELPKPVTKQVADLFNRIFGRE
jgi:RHS repeat-associated protein